MIASYDVFLVALSLAIAVTASYTALDLAGRVTVAQGQARKLWLTGGAIAMGIGIWSMHFIAMLAYKLPISTSYNSLMVFASLAVAVIASGLALYIVSRQQVNRSHFVLSGSFMGLAIALMHYTGMFAMQLEADVEYNFMLVVLSVIIAIGVSLAALWLAFQLRSQKNSSGWKIGSAIIMGHAIAGMHYTAMAAVCFHSTTNPAVIKPFHSTNHTLLAVVIGIGALVILALALQAAFVERRINVESSLKESQRRLATLIDTLPGIAFSSNNDSQWSMTYLSEGCLELTGYKSEELVGQEGGYSSIIHPEDLSKVTQTINIAIAKKQPYIVEYSIRTRSGQQKWLWEKGSGVFNDKGEVLGLEGFITDITERKHFEAQLAYSANHDPLTGLINRRYFREQLEHHLALAQSYNYCGVLLFIDLDDFKDINDTLGHQAGDELLKNLAILLQDKIRQTDILARLGGDEFAILLPQTSSNESQVIAQRIFEALENHVAIANGQPVRITASIGATLFPEHSMIADELLAQADLAMYKSKQNGRNCLSLHISGGNWRVQVESRNVWKNRICEALEQDLFVLYYQPILDLRTHQTCSYELLLRMLGKQGELIAPNVFLPIAESSGLICNIDRWVVRQAIYLIAVYARVGLDLQLEVNLSGKSLSDNELLPMIQQELTKTGINPASLMLEITETAAIADISQARKFIHTLKQMGCKFALDDFGVGYSSFSQLKHLPVDYLKIDGSFIKNFSRNLVDRHLVKAIVEVAHGLEKYTIAEFVEDEDTLQMLHQLGVDHAQGYYIGEPKAVAELPLVQVKEHNCIQVKSARA